jgi:hypothetical protein
VTSSDTVTFNFTIPTGSKFFAGTEVDQYNLSTASVEGAKIGDFYLNTTTGIVYAKNAEVGWTRTEGSLQGPIGESLKFIDSFIISSSDVTDISEFLNEKYAGNFPETDEIVAVDYDGLSYWYCYIDGVWKSIASIDSSASLLVSSRQDGSNDKAYDTAYVNSLVVDGDNVAVDDKPYKTYSI